MTTPANPDDLLAFLRAQLDADAAEIAKHPDDYDSEAWDLSAEEETNYPCLPYLRIGKKRALAEVDAKRRILDEHAPIEQRGLWDEKTQAYDTEIVCGTCVFIGDDEDAGGNRFRYREHAGWPCATALLLALPHADRPGYRKEWRP